MSEYKYREEMIDEIREVLDEYDYEYSDYAIKDIFDEFWSQKEPVINVFRNHPNWDERKLMIHFDQDYTREIDRTTIRNFASWLERTVRDASVINAKKARNGAPKRCMECFGTRIFAGYKCIHEGCVRHPELNTTLFKIDAAGRESNRADRVCDFINYAITDQFFNDGMKDSIDAINNLNPNYMLRTNMKSSKAILKICREEGWDKLGGTYTDRQGKERNVFDREYSALSDALNPIKVKRHTYLSFHPVDYLLMSNGTSWKSCHNISEPGCYSSGTIAYMLDPSSFVFYTLPAEFDGDDPEREPKINREMFGYADGSFVQSRLYPQSCDSGADHVYKETREIVQKVIADSLNVPNLWAAPERNLDIVGEYVRQEPGATNYPDWHRGAPGSTHVCLSRLKTKGGFTRITFGAQPICIECGERNDVTENINCCDSGTRRCECCGRRVDEDEIYWCEDVNEYRCSNCSSWCERCECQVGGETFRVLRITRWGRSEEWVCEDCLENYYSSCEYCEEYWDNDDTYWVDDTCLCPDCYESKVRTCEECGEDHLKENMVEIDGKWYCEDCTVTCDECGQIVPVSNAQIFNGKWTCDECLEKEIEDDESDDEGNGNENRNCEDAEIKSNEVDSTAA